jgi:uncharacterized protein (TIGR01777 family)
MSLHIVIAGGTGFIGNYLTDQFHQLGHKVSIISRHQPSVTWDDFQGLVDVLEGADLLINLAGKSVNCRYNKENKEEILRSRTASTQLLGDAIQKCVVPPKLWINSSTATIYRHATDKAMTESTGEIGTGFSVDVAKKWEKAFFDFDLPHTRQIALRIAIVLGEGGGVMTPFINLVRFGLGGVQGNGNQRFSWIHIEDLLQIMLFLWSNPQLAGIFNCSSPNPVDNRTLMKSLRKQLGSSFGLPSPEWLLKIGAVAIGTETELILKSRWVVPEKLEHAGYKFKFPQLDLALSDILKN